MSAEVVKWYLSGLGIAPVVPGSVTVMVEWRQIMHCGQATLRTLCELCLMSHSGLPINS